MANIDLQKNVTHDSLQALYLDWVNNYLTREKMAEHYEMPINELDSLISIGRRVHEERTGDLTPY